MQLAKYTIGLLTDSDMTWFVETACVNMLTHEVGRSELVNIDHLYVLSDIVAISETAFIVKKDGIPVGAIAGILSPNLYNPKIMNLGELFWYVLPEHRQSRAGLMLLNAFKDKADEVADESTLSLLTKSKVNIKTLAKKEFQLAEFGFWRGK